MYILYNRDGVEVDRTDDFEEARKNRNYLNRMAWSKSPFYIVETEDEKNA